MVGGEGVDQILSAHRTGGDSPRRTHRGFRWRCSRGTFGLEQYMAWQIMPSRVLLSPFVPSECGSISFVSSCPRILDVYSSTGPPIDDLAREAWLMERAAEGRISVFLTSWEGRWSCWDTRRRPRRPTSKSAVAEGMPVLRRLTGGTGVIHRGDLGVGLALPLEHPWARGIVGLYGRFLDVLGPALRSLGSDVSRLRRSRSREPGALAGLLSRSAFGHPGG